MIRGRCPICSKPFEIGKIQDLPTFPFCCERCRLVDLGRWVDEAYAIPGPPAVGANGASPTVLPEIDDEDDG